MANVASPPSPPAQTAAVFVIDDDESYRELLVAALELHCGVDAVRAFGDGAAALDAAAALPPAQQPRLVLVDLHMPEPGGLAVLRALRARGQAGSVVVISNAASAAERQQCQAEGGRFLSKPVRFEELVAALQALLPAAGALPQRPQAVRIVLADDHELVRSGIRALLETADDLEVVGEADDGRQLMDVLARVRADLVMVDLSMPHVDGLRAIERIHAEYPGLRVVVLSMNEAGEVAKRALAKGAAGYLLKQAAPQELQLAVRSVMARGSYLSPQIAQAMAQPDALTPEEQLTTRQIEVLTRIAQGLTAREIGAELNLSAKTVDVHRTRIMEKLGLSDIAGLTRYALRHGLVN